MLFKKEVYLNILRIKKKTFSTHKFILEERSENTKLEKNSYIFQNKSKIIHQNYLELKNNTKLARFVSGIRKNSQNFLGPLNDLKKLQHTSKILSNQVSPLNRSKDFTRKSLKVCENSKSLKQISLTKKFNKFTNEKNLVNFGHQKYFLINHHPRCSQFQDDKSVANKLASLMKKIIQNK